MRRIRAAAACIALLAGLPACKPSGDHLPRAKMAAVVADLQLADAYSFAVRDTTKFGVEKNLDSLARWSNEILAQHGLSRDEFNRSMDWYRDRPVELDSLFAAVIPVLEQAGR